jgi:hypothetical protein
MTADEVRARIKAKRQELVDLIATIDDADLAKVGPDGGWAIKDHLVHIGAWERWLLALFEGRDRLLAMGTSGEVNEVDDINEQVWQLHRNDSIDEARRYFDDAHRDLMSTLAEKTTEDLDRPYHSSFDDAAGLTLLAPVAANTYEHYDEHIGWIKEMRAKPAQR